MSQEARKVEGLDSYEIEAWIMRLGSWPTAVLHVVDKGESYSIERASVLSLENGQFALVTEFGCSCYEAKDANIDLYPTEGDALNSLRDWERKRDA